MSGAHKPHGPNCDGCLMLKITAERDVARTQRDALQAQVDAVKALHRRRPWSVDDFVHFGQTEFPDVCDHDPHIWPCPTIAALGETGDES